MNTFPDFNPAKVENYVDWRQPKNRKNAIARVTDFRYWTGDLDHGHSGRVAVDVMGLDKEGMAWFAVLFGQSYRVANATLVMQIFPNVATVSEKEVLKWMEAESGVEDKPLNGNRLIYGNDTKWNRWKLHKSIASIQEWLDGRSLYESLLELVSHNNTQQNRMCLENAVRSWQQFGWMSTWLTLQMLYDFFGWDIDTWQLPFKDNWSSYNGLMYIYNQTDRMSSKSYKPTPQDVRYAEDCFLDLKDYLLHEHTIPYISDSFSIESVLCEYRKTAYGPVVKEYTGWTSSELAVQYPEWKRWWENTSEVNFKPVLAGIMCRHPLVQATKPDKKYFRILFETGMLQNVDYVYEEMPDVYKHLDLVRPTEAPIESVHAEWNRTPKRKIWFNKHKPTNYLRRK